MRMFYLAPSGQKLVGVIWVWCKDCPHHEAQHLFGQDYIFLDNIIYFSTGLHNYIVFTWQTRSTPPSMASFFEDMFSMIAPAIAMAHRVNLWKHWDWKYREWTAWCILTTQAQQAQICIFACNLFCCIFHLLPIASKDWKAGLKIHMLP